MISHHFITFSWSELGPIFHAKKSHQIDHYLKPCQLCNCLILNMVHTGSGTPRYFTATWDDQLPMEIGKIFAAFKSRDGEQPRVSWRQGFQEVWEVIFFEVSGS